MAGVAQEEITTAGTETNAEQNPSKHNFQSPLLRKHGLVVNTLHCILICIGCQGIINPGKIREHFSAFHKFYKTLPKLQNEIDKDLERYPTLTKDPRHPQEAVEPIYGLAPPIPNHIECMTCHHCYVSKKTFELHSCPCPTPSTIVTHVQQFRKFNGSPWFPVKQIHTSHIPQTRWHTYNQSLQAGESIIKSPAFDDDHRILHQFLHKEGWIGFVDGRQHETLMPLVAFSQQDPVYGPLHKLIVLWLNEAQLQTNSFYLRRLIGTRPMEEHDETVVRHHRSVNQSTIENYSRFVAGLVSFIHRIVMAHKSEYQIAIPPEIQAHCRTLISSIEASLQEHETGLVDEPELETPYFCDSDNDSELGDEETIGGGTHVEAMKSCQNDNKNLTALLYSLFTQEPGGQKTDFFSPITHYIVLSSLRKEQEWARGGTITHTIAAILFTGRLVFSRRINELVEERKCKIAE